MKLATTITLLIIITCHNLFAEDAKVVELLNNYDKDTIYLYSNYLGKWYVKNGIILPLGRSGANLKKEMKDSKFAIEEMQKAQSYSKIGTITGLIAGSIGLTGTILEVLDADYSHKREIYISMVVSSAILGTASKWFHQSAVGAMNRAVWLYNRDILSEKMR